MQQECVLAFQDDQGAQEKRTPLAARAMGKPSKRDPSELPEVPLSPLDLQPTSEQCFLYVLLMSKAKFVQVLSAWPKPHHRRAKKQGAVS